MKAFTILLLSTLLLSGCQTPEERAAKAAALEEQKVQYCLNQGTQIGTGEYNVCRFQVEEDIKFMKRVKHECAMLAREAIPDDLVAREALANRCVREEKYKYEQMEQMKLQTKAMQKQADKAIKQ